MTNLKKTLTTRIGLALFALLLFAAGLTLGTQGRIQTTVQAYAQDFPTRLLSVRQPDFTVGYLQGRYASEASEATADEKGVSHYARCVGLVTFDGNGNFTDVETHSFDGFIVHEQNHGTYEVRPDGTGVMHVTVIGPDGNPIKFDENFTIYDGGKEIIFIVAADGSVSTGVLKRQ